MNARRAESISTLTANIYTGSDLLGRIANHTLNRIAQVQMPSTRSSHAKSLHGTAIALAQLRPCTSLVHIDNKNTRYRPGCDSPIRLGKFSKPVHQFLLIRSRKFSPVNDRGFFAAWLAWEKLESALRESKNLLLAL
jgi:hypothetical protein